MTTPSHPVGIHVEPQLTGRNRVTVGFRIFLAIPHLILVGGPTGAIASWSTQDDSGISWGVAGGAFGALVALSAIVAWFAIVFTGKHPQGLWDLAVYYMRWRVRAVSYIALLRDEYPPFGPGEYPARLDLELPTSPRNRVTVAFRFILALPHCLAVLLLGVAWMLTTVIAWMAIVFTGAYPAGLYRFGVGVLRWSTRVEAYMFLLRDEYPPFSLELRQGVTVTTSSPSMPMKSSGFAV